LLAKRNNMHLPRPPAVIVGLGILLHPGQSIAQPLCKPEIAIKSVRLSEPISLKRYWTAIVDVDASACAASSGLFALGFARLSETAPDLEFSEPFVWRAGQMKVRVEFWWDEAVERYWVADVAACLCRAK
jgi:hypothetical protein